MGRVDILVSSREPVIQFSVRWEPVLINIEGSPGVAVLNAEHVKLGFR